MKTLIFQQQDTEDIHVIDILYVEKKGNKKIYRSKSKHNNYNSVTIHDNIVNVLLKDDNQIKGELIKLTAYHPNKLFIYGGKIYAAETNIKIHKEKDDTKKTYTLKSEENTHKYKMKINDVEIKLERDGYTWYETTILANNNITVIDECIYSESPYGTACCILLESKLDKFELHTIQEYNTLID